ncbi:hypothetical protein [Pedobacter nototheniae]|uniref:hypothetical protein n=1 Tax=Pedobacter nototheniae TaxID=2488994 RepID=UPI00292E58D6|nr:hypothetical protein [Pedobacter nototheniae]
MHKQHQAGAVEQSKGKSLDAAAIKALTNLSDIRSKPFSYAFFVIVFYGRHAFATLRFVTFSSRKK